MTKIFLAGPSADTPSGPVVRVIRQLDDAATTPESAEARPSEPSLTRVEICRVEHEAQPDGCSAAPGPRPSAQTSSRRAASFALLVAAIGSILTFAVNGQDLVRSAIALFIWFFIGWHAGKVIYATPAALPHPSAEASDE